jgi:predicted Zn-ribbon and HTH transcriptional regulator
VNASPDLNNVLQQRYRFINRMLKKAKIRLLTSAAHCRECVFAGVYRAATVREPVPKAIRGTLKEFAQRFGVGL